MKNISLEGKCGSCIYFKNIAKTCEGECQKHPYSDDVVHDPEHPCWIVARSRPKCRLYTDKGGE